MTMVGWMAPLRRGWMMALAMLVTMVLAGCGGGGDAGTPILQPPTAPGGSVATLQVRITQPTSASVDTSGTQTITARITALNSSGQGVSGVPITLQVDKNATYFFSGASGATTGNDGTVTATLTIGNDNTPRQITLLAAATGTSVTGSATLNVVASNTQAADLILTATPTTLQNSVTNTASVTVTAVNANREGLAGIPVTFSVDNGATFSTGGLTATNAAGTITATVRIGSDQSNRTINVTARSGGVSRTAAIQVAGAKLSASGFASSVAAGSQGNRIVYLLTDNTGAKMANYPVTVRAAGLADVSGSTNVDGEFVYTYNAPGTAQSLTIQATAGGTTDTQTVTVAGAVNIPVVSTTVNSASVSANPSVVLVNAAGSTSNKTEVRALFLGTNNAPVKNVRVWFDLDGDKQSIGGSFDSTAARVLLYSDANGIARTTYAPGTRLSPKDGVTVRVCWDYADFTIPAEGGACPHSATTTLTVVSESLSVSIGTNGLLANGRENLTYIQRFAVQVVDSAGIAKAGVKITPSIDLLTYYKGRWFPNLAAERWEQSVTATCANEDLNRNGVSENFLDTLSGAVVPEDANGSFNLTPGRPALEPRKADVSVSVEGSDATDANGIVVVRIEYPQNVGSWVRYNLIVSASGVAGTEGRANVEADLAVLAASVNNTDVDPPFKLSPYGLLASPTVLRRNAEGQSGALCTNPN